jgi:hypothetical protein
MPFTNPSSPVSRKNVGDTATNTSVKRMDSRVLAREKESIEERMRAPGSSTDINLLVRELLPGRMSRPVLKSSWPSITIRKI